VSRTGPGDVSAAPRAAKAYFDCVNANGGINGRPIHYTIVDDNGQPDRAAEVAAKLLTGQKVVGLVGSSSFVDCTINAPLYNERDVMAIASYGLARECYFSKNIAPLSEGPRLSLLGAAEYVKATIDVKHVACIVAQIDFIGQWACGGVLDWGRGHDVKVDLGLADTVSLEAGSVLLQAASYHPDAIGVALPMEAALAIFDAAQQHDLGSKYKWFGASSLFRAEFAKRIGRYWEGKVFVEEEFAPLDAHGPDLDNWRVVMDRYSSANEPRNAFSQSGYLAARVATEALLRLDPAEIDRAAVTAAFRGIKGFKSDMLCGSWYVGPGSEHLANHAGNVGVVAKGGFETKASCINLEDPEIADALNLESQNGLAK
jgi:branched-chain amino acid transport system substrate-binding protein